MMPYVIIISQKKDCGNEKIKSLKLFKTDFAYKKLSVFQIQDNTFRDRSTKNRSYQFKDNRNCGCQYQMKQTQSQPCF